MARRKDARERILKAAFEAFTTSTYGKVSIDEITKKAKVSKGGLFHHFDSKYALARDALFWFMEREMEGFFALEDGKAMSPEKRLKRFIDFGMDVMVDNIKFARLMIDVYEEALDMRRDKDMWLDFFSKYVGYLEDIFTQMKAKDPRAKAMLLLSSMDGLAMYYIFFYHSGEPMDIDKLREELYRMYIPEDKKTKGRRADVGGK